MVVSFHVEYHTKWGEEIGISGTVPPLGNGNLAKAFLLQTTDGIHWSGQIEMTVPPQGAMIEYTYGVYQNKNVVRQEWDGFSRRVFLVGDNHKRYHIEDCWKEVPDRYYLYSSVFAGTLSAHSRQADARKSYPQGLVLKAYAPRVTDDYCLAVCGNREIVGNWNPDKAFLMSDANFPEWQVELDAGKLAFPLEYKFVLYNKKKQKAEAWERGENRYLINPAGRPGDTFVCSGRYVSFDLPDWKGSGVAVPVFSLKSESSFGIGDFGDLKKMTDWAACTRQKVVQILPINDTTMTHTRADSYPYNSISIYAFHPLYLDLRWLGKLNDKQQMDLFDQKQKELNALKSVDYEAVEKVKSEYVRLIYEQEGDKVLASDAFKQFFADNKEWLLPYAAYSYLRDIHHTANFRDWPQHATYSAKEVEAFCRPGTTYYRQIALHYYTQFNLHLQLSEASAYARNHGVMLKGDIPIGISRNSVEAWTEPHYFNLDGQAGAPPDDFSVTGQNWGFPTYNWDVMEKDGYKWWIKRFQKMSEYFDAYRIDHILGFFRIWEIPTNAVQGLLGRFVPALPMSREEIEGYGFPFRKDFCLKPYIHESFLSQLFGSCAEHVKQTFIEPAETPGTYRMRPAFDTQRKVEAFFNSENVSESLCIRDGLYSLISNVLFVADGKEPDKYHPRIGVQLDFIYRVLNDQEKNAFNRLYDDFYYRRHSEFWYQQAMKKLPQLTRSTRMPVCGEDLGMIPEGVGRAMNDLHILSLEVERMPKASGREFGRLAEYPYWSVCTISTHDMSNLRAWWEEDEQRTQHYYNNVLGHVGAAPGIATPEICEEVVNNHLKSNSMLCIFSLQDWLSIDGSRREANANEERINIPSDPQHYWRYRMHLSLEQLAGADELNEKMRRMVEQAGRSVSL